MPKRVLTDAFISVGGTDISNMCNQVTLDYSADTPEKTGFGDDTHEMAAGGLKNWSLSLTANTDFDGAELDSVLFPLIGVEAAIIVRPTSAPVGVANPQFSGQAILASYTPVAGNIGDMANTPINFVAAGTLARATS